MKKIHIFFLACIDRSSKHPKVGLLDRTNGPSVVKFLKEHIQIHGVPPKFRIDQARYLIGNQNRNLANRIIST